LTEARSAIREGRPEDALAMLSHCAKGAGPAAENAAYEMGRVLRTCRSWKPWPSWVKRLRRWPRLRLSWRATQIASVATKWPS
jgi:hypothetical protein